MTISGSLRAQAQESLLHEIVPWWLSHGLDEVEGGVFTYWNDEQTELASTDKYTWSQGRWLNFAADLLEFAPARGILDDYGIERLEKHARLTRDAIRSRVQLDDGRFAALSTKDWRPKFMPGADSYHVSVFADLFCILGVSSACRIFGSFEADWAWVQEAFGRIVNLIDTSRYDCAPIPRLNGYDVSAVRMIALDVASDLHRTSRSPSSADHARNLLNSLLGGYEKMGAFLEYPHVGGPVSESMSGRILNPGHAFETIWFILDALPMLDEERAGEVVRSVSDAAHEVLRTGWDIESGGFYWLVDRDGGPPQGRITNAYEANASANWDRKLWWTQIEASVALTLLAERDIAFERARDDALAWCLERYRRGWARDWRRVLTRFGREVPIDALAAVPLRDIFHQGRGLIRILSETPAGRARSALHS